MISSLPFVILISLVVLGTHGLLLEVFFISGTSLDITFLTISNSPFSVFFRTELWVRCWNASDFLTFLSFVILFLGNFLFLFLWTVLDFILAMEYFISATTCWFPIAGSCSLNANFSLSKFRLILAAYFSKIWESEWGWGFLHLECQLLLNLLIVQTLTHCHFQLILVSLVQLL